MGCGIAPSMLLPQTLLHIYLAAVYQRGATPPDYPSWKLPILCICLPCKCNLISLSLMCGANAVHPCRQPQSSHDRSAPARVESDNTFVIQPPPRLAMSRSRTAIGVLPNSPFWISPTTSESHLKHVAVEIVSHWRLASLMASFMCVSASLR